MSTLIFGRHPIIDAIESGQTIDKVFIQQGTRGELEKEMRHLCKKQEIPLIVTPKERLDKMVLRGQNHQGLIAMVALAAYQKLDNVLPFIYEKSENPLFLLLDGITDVRNFGAIARTAECMGVHAIVVANKNAAPVNAEAMKASAGALSKIPICRATSIMNAVELLQKSGVQVFASDLQAEKNIYDIDFIAPTALVLGAEDEGVSHAILRKVNDRFIIPQVGTTDSLNVSVAAGMMLYEVAKQRFLKINK